MPRNKILFFINKHKTNPAGNRRPNKNGYGNRKKKKKKMKKKKKRKKKSTLRKRIQV